MRAKSSELTPGMTTLGFWNTTNAHSRNQFLKSVRYLPRTETSQSVLWRIPNRTRVRACARGTRHRPRRSWRRCSSGAAAKERGDAEWVASKSLNLSLPPLGNFSKNCYKLHKHQDDGLVKALSYFRCKLSTKKLLSFFLILFRGRKQMNLVTKLMQKK